MRQFVLTLMVAFALAPAVAPAQESGAQAAGESRLFELRVYYPAEGKLADLHDRSRRHTTRLYERHGIAEIASFTARGGEGDKLIVLLAYPSRADRDRAWAALVADPEWVRVKRATDRDGRLVEKLQEYLMLPAPDCPAVRPLAAGAGRTFELVTHAAAPGDEEAGHRRLRAEHPGSELLGSWALEARRGADAVLIHWIRKSPPKREEVVLASAAAGLPAVGPREPAAPTARPGFGRLPLTPTDYSPSR